jgi:cysteine desulfurase
MNLIFVRLYSNIRLHKYKAGWQFPPRRGYIIMREIYLDNAATTQVCKESADVAYKVMTVEYGNPSSTHSKGRRANDILVQSRQKIADALGCGAEEVYFTSCGSEGDNWAVRSGAHLQGHHGGHIISSTVEHDAIRNTLASLREEGYEITLLSPEADGSISPKAVLDALRPDTVLVSLMMVNNETGAVTNIAEIAEQVKRKSPKIIFHTDAVQAFAKIKFSADALGVDLLTISGHKIHAPKGIGALYIRKGLAMKPLIYGGAQERSLRAGTESLPLIAAFGTAAEIAFRDMDRYVQQMQKCKALCVQLLRERIPGIWIFQSEAPHILSISLPGYRSEVLLNYLDGNGIYVSRSSACKKGRRSHVLEALGLNARIIDGAIRISFSRFTTEEDIRDFCTVLSEAASTLLHD